MKCVEEARGPARCWKSYLLQEREVLGLFAKMKVAARHGVSCGPPLHDCLFVEKSASLPGIAAAMSGAVFETLGVRVLVRQKELEPYTPEPAAFHLQFNSAKFDEKDFVANTHLASQEAIEASLAEYNRWLSRFFVCIVKEINPSLRITTVPRTPPAVRGLVNIRGQVVLVMDLAVIFGRQQRPVTGGPR